jgi:hypothetical protein
MSLAGKPRRRPVISRANWKSPWRQTTPAKPPLIPTELAIWSLLWKCTDSGGTELARIFNIVLKTSQTAR